MTATADRLVSLKTGNSFTFEAESCSRCGGSGHYSYCQSHGTRCFKCGGHGLTLTKRGALAQNVYNELLKINAEDIQPGMKVMSDALPGFTSAAWHVVKSIELDGDSVEIVAEGYTVHSSMSSLVRIARTKAEKLEFRSIALAYQATLTKTGKPRKR